MKPEAIAVERKANNTTPNRGHANGSIQCAQPAVAPAAPRSSFFTVRPTVRKNGISNGHPYKADDREVKKDANEVGEKSNGHATALPVDPLAEARKAVYRDPKLYMIFVSAVPALFFSEAGKKILVDADAVLIDLDETDRQMINSAEIQRWITATYDLGRQVYIAASPARLDEAVDLRRRSVITVSKTGHFAGKSGQGLADKLTDHYEEMAKKIPVDRASLPRRSSNVPRKEWAPVVSLPDPDIDRIHYQRVLTPEEEKIFDRLLDEADR
jgi:hypothetical protein